MKEKYYKASELNISDHYIQTIQLKEYIHEKERGKP